MVTTVPSGTVTFLFTDIEGSTERWEHHREAMQRALERHDAQVRAAIEAQVKRTTPVGVFAEGDSPVGAADMSGNVVEWTSSLFGAGDVESEVPEYGYPYDGGDGRENLEASPSVCRVVRSQ